MALARLKRPVDRCKRPNPWGAGRANRPGCSPTARSLGPRLGVLQRGQKVGRRLKPLETGRNRPLLWRGAMRRTQGFDSGLLQLACLRALPSACDRSRACSTCTNLPVLICTAVNPPRFDRHSSLTVAVAPLIEALYNSSNRTVAVCFIVNSQEIAPPTPIAIGLYEKGLGSLEAA